MFNFKNKNVLFILNTFDLGGAERQAISLANHLQNNLNCNVRLLSYQDAYNPITFSNLCDEYNLNDRKLIKSPFDTGKRFKFFKKCVKLFLLGRDLKKNFKPDVIIPYLSGSSILAQLLKYPSGAKYTFWNHRGSEVYKDNFFEKMAISLCSVFLANSPNGKEELIRQFKLNEKKVHFVPNFNTLINPVLIEKKYKSSLTIGMIAHFRIEKLQPLLIESCLPLFCKYPNLKLLLVGNVSDKKNIKTVLSLIKNHKLEGRIEVYHNRLAIDFLSVLDIGVLISSIEGMSNTIMEYMSFQLPVLASDHPGSRILLCENNFNFLVNNNENEISQKLEILINSVELRNNLGVDNKKRIENNFSIEKYILNLEKIINRC